MQIVYLFGLGASAACAAPTLTDAMFARLYKRSLLSRREDNSKDNTDQSGESKTGIIIAGVVFAVVITAVLIGIAIFYFRDPHNFLKRRQRKRLSHLSTAASEVDRLKRPSMASDRESFMYSRTRSSSLQFTVPTEETPQLQAMQKVFYREGDTSVQLEQVDTSYSPANNAMNEEVHRDDAHDSSDRNSNSSTITVVVTPPLEHDGDITNQRRVSAHDNISDVQQNSFPDHDKSNDESSALLHNSS